MARRQRGQLNAPANEQRGRDHDKRRGAFLRHRWERRIDLLSVARMQQRKLLAPAAAARSCKAASAIGLVGSTSMKMSAPPGIKSRNSPSRFGPSSKVK